MFVYNNHMSEERKILVVEDEQPMVQILTDRLELEGFSVVSAKNGEEGLEVFKQESPDLIVLDIVMPKMNGSEFLQNLMKSDAGREVPVMCLTNLEAVPESVSGLMQKHDNITYVVKVNTRLDSIISQIKSLLET